MKIVLDTNVLVSGLINPHGPPARILSLLLNEEIKLAVDSRILAEYRAVLQRPKFGFDKTHVSWLLDYIEQVSFSVTATAVGLNLPDPGDEPFLEVAMYAEAESLVTGNTKHFPKKKRKGVAVYTAQEFLSKFFA